MRSGSTFAGEFLGQNPDAFYWFEPIDGVISHLYGSTLGIFPIDITQHRNGTDRFVKQNRFKNRIDISRL